MILRYSPADFLAALLNPFSLAAGFMLFAGVVILAIDGACGIGWIAAAVMTYGHALTDDELRRLRDGRESRP